MTEVLLSTKSMIQSSVQCCRFSSTVTDKIFQVSPLNVSSRKLKLIKRLFSYGHCGTCIHCSSTIIVNDIKICCSRTSDCILQPFHAAADCQQLCGWSNVVKMSVIHKLRVYSSQHGHSKKNFVGRKHAESDHYIRLCKN